MNSRFPIAAVAFASMFGCTNASTPSSANTSISLVRLSVCDLARNVDYVGRFEVVEITATKSTNASLRSTNLRLQATVLGQPPNENSWVLPEAVAIARGPEVAKVRALKTGQELRTELTVPSGVRVGDSIMVFLTYSTVFKNWHDVNGQGVFFRNPSGLMENSMVYVDDHAITEADLLSEIRRGSQLSRSGSPRCDEGAFIALPSDAGTEAPDSGR